MQKPSEGIGRSDAGQRLNKRFLERFTRASAHAPQDSFQPGKGCQMDPLVIRQKKQLFVHSYPPYN
ncbi:MAG TPA: hypothetical protein VHD63_27975 [Ktedonobacteraceae bacterium]|nr:hypothetical protein [Ktedonobacteraceae bacterium]